MSDQVSAIDHCAPSCASTLTLGQTSRDSFLLGCVRLAQQTIADYPAHLSLFTGCHLGDWLDFGLVGLG
jgi:hypothetical protein